MCAEAASSDRVMQIERLVFQYEESSTMVRSDGSAGEARGVEGCRFHLLTAQYSVQYATEAAASRPSGERAAVQCAQ